MSSYFRICAVIAFFVATACGGDRPAASAATAAVTSSVPATSEPAPKLWRPATAPSGAPAGYDWIAIDLFDGKSMVAAVQKPAAGGPSPIVVVLHPAGGLRARHLALAAMFPKEGFITVTPCWQFWSDPNDTEPLSCSSTAPDRNAAGDVVKDVMAVVDAARTLPGARRDRVALVGHSAGAMAGVLTGSMGGRVDTVVAMSAGYGLLIRQQWGTALPDQVDGLAVPLLIVHGTNDTNTPGTAVAAARAYEKTALDKGKKVESIYIEGAPHTFPYIPEFWTDDVKSKVLGFIRKNLAG